MPRRIAALLPLAFLSSVAAGVRATDEDAPPALRYVVRSNAELTHLDVEVCFGGQDVPRVLIPGVASAAPALVGARDARGRQLPAPGGHIDLANIPPRSCIRYRVDLDAALSTSRVAGRWDGDVMISAGVWLWRPPTLPDGRTTLRFDLPDGLRAAVPWPAFEHGEYRLPPSAFRRPAFLALGRFEPLTFERAGAVVNVARLGAGWALEPPDVERWLARAIDGVARVQGRFPVDRLLVVIVPSEGDDLRFGMVRRGGGDSVAFVVGRASSYDDLLRSWITWHELSHFQLPPMRQRDAWFYEGFATYYQEVLRARLGLQSAADAWRELVAGLERGARAGRRGASLESEAATMMRTGAFSHVYWAGTAFVLEADVALRMHASSLDQVVARSAPAFRSQDRLWTSAEVAALWDRTLERRVLRPMSARWAARIDFPDTGSLMRRLGVHVDADGIELRSDAELARERDAIMQPPPRADTLHTELP